MSEGADLTLAALLRGLTTRFAQAGIESARLDARILVRHFLNLRDADIIAAPEMAVVQDTAYAALMAAVIRRESREPVSKILGTREFFGLDFITGPDVLDPRADSEILIETALGFARSRGPDAPLRILDLGTGSGCLIVTLLHLLPQVHGVAVDISEKALAVAAANAARHAVEDRLTLLQGEWLAPVLEMGAGDAAHRPVFDIVVANPPYIPHGDIESLMPEVRNYDPILALDGGVDGLDPYRIILENISAVIHPQGRIFFEYGMNQADDISRLAKDYGFAIHGLYRDLSGHNRVVSCGLGAK